MEPLPAPPYCLGGCMPKKMRGPIFSTSSQGKRPSSSISFATGANSVLANCLAIRFTCLCWIEGVKSKFLPQSNTTILARKLQKVYNGILRLSKQFRNDKEHLKRRTSNEGKY